MQSRSFVRCGQPLSVVFRRPDVLAQLSATQLSTSHGQPDSLESLVIFSSTTRHHWKKALKSFQFDTATTAHMWFFLLNMRLILMLREFIIKLICLKLTIKRNAKKFFLDIMAKRLGINLIKSTLFSILLRLWVIFYCELQSAAVTQLVLRRCPDIHLVVVELTATDNCVNVKTALVDESVTCASRPTGISKSLILMVARVSSCWTLFMCTNSHMKLLSSNAKIVCNFFASVKLDFELSDNFLWRERTEYSCSFYNSVFVCLFMAHIWNLTLSFHNFCRLCE